MKLKTRIKLKYILKDIIRVLGFLALAGAIIYLNILIS